jgi:DNA-binding beta-propeller fold protein YncE
MGYGPTGMAIDSSGDLWVANQLSGTVVEYSPAELAQASPAPTVTIHVEGAGGVAFDPSGNLWASINFATAPVTGAVEEFTKAELAKSGTRRRWCSPSAKGTADPRSTPQETCGRAATAKTR